MSDCNLIVKCAFYNDRIKDMEKVGLFLKQIYCQQKPEVCARRNDAGDRDVSDIYYDLTPWGLESKQ